MGVYEEFAHEDSQRIKELEAEVEQWKASFARVERLRRKAVQKTRRKHNEIKRLRQDLGLAFDERDEARSELYRLRKLCADRPMLHVPSQERDDWREKIDAAGKGE